MKEHELSVPADLAGQRLDRVLAEAVPGLSRTRVARLVSAGHVRVDGVVVTSPSRRLRGGEVVRAAEPEPPPSTLVPEDVPLSILHEEAGFLVVDKPAGMVVHPGAGIHSGTLVHALLHHLGDGIVGVGGERRPGIVHRLDKGTSGVLVVAKTPAAHADLSAQLARREVEKEYLALVLGRPPAEGRADAALGRSSRVRTRMAARPDGRPALTTWRRIEAFGDHCALLAVRLVTGRTHQARVHLALAGYPIVGDVTYGGRRVRAVTDPGRRALLAALRRPALHAYQLRLRRPGTGEWLEFTAPLPPDLEELLLRLRG